VRAGFEAGGREKRGGNYRREGALARQCLLRQARRIKQEPDARQEHLKYRKRETVRTENGLPLQIEECAPASAEDFDLGEPRSGRVD